MKRILAWLPIVITALLMWYARSINVGVTNYNIFLLSLLAWCLIIIMFYRLTQGPRG
jgi:SNF family Na+-dependent transporter